MRLMKQEDPDGVKLRKQRRLKRRIYRNKVTILIRYFCIVAIQLFSYL